MAQCNSAVVSWDVLPAGTLERVLAHLAGDVPSLCAAACVARAWHVAAAEPRLWVSLARLSFGVAFRLTDERLAALVARAGGRLERLDVSGAGELTDEGLATALQQPHLLTKFTANSGCERLSARGVAASLQSRLGGMYKLRVGGLCSIPRRPDEQSRCTTWEMGDQAWHGEAHDVYGMLDALLAPEGELDFERMCKYLEYDPSRTSSWSLPVDHRRCLVLCGRLNICTDAECRAPLCDTHNGGPFEECSVCGRKLCCDHVRGPPHRRVHVCALPVGPRSPSVSVWSARLRI